MFNFSKYKDSDVRVVKRETAIGTYFIPQYYEPPHKFLGIFNCGDEWVSFYIGSGCPYHVQSIDNLIWRVENQVGSRYNIDEHKRILTHFKNKDNAIGHAKLFKKLTLPDTIEYEITATEKK